LPSKTDSKMKIKIKLKNRLVQFLKSFKNKKETLMKRSLRMI